MTFKELAITLCNIDDEKNELNIAQMRSVLNRLCSILDLEVLAVLLKEQKKIKG